MIDDILRRLAELPGLEGFAERDRLAYLLYSNRGETRSSVLVFVFAPGEPDPRAIVKLRRDRESVAREAHTLRRLSLEIPGRVPRVHLTGEIGRWAFVAMEGMAGQPITPWEFETHAGALLRALVEIHGPMRGGMADKATVGAEMLEPLREFERVWGSGCADLALLCRSLRERVETLRGVGFPVIPQHGDFCLDNVLVGRDRGVVVLDWEEFATVQLPGYDLVVLFASLVGRNVLEERKLAHLLAESLRVYAREMGVEARWLGVLVPLSMIRFVLFCAGEERLEPAELVLSRLRTLAGQGGLSVIGL